MSLLLLFGGGAATPSATLAWTEANDTAAIAATFVTTATVAWTEAADTTAIAATFVSTASIAWTEDGDVWLIANAPAIPGRLVRHRAPVALRHAERPGARHRAPRAHTHTERATARHRHHATISGGSRQ